jgi:BlaI family penicillinase repressor
VGTQNASVSEAELEVLKVLWEHGPGTVRVLHTLLQEQGQRWAYTTVQTLLQRLEAKGHVSADRSGAAHVFRAAVSREALLDRRLRDLAEELCDGTTSPLLLALVEGGRLTEEEVRRLRQMLDELEKGPAGPRPRGRRG